MQPMSNERRVLVSGATGLIGRHVVHTLQTAGWTVFRLVRGTEAKTGEIAWQPGTRTIDKTALEGFDAVVHLAGEPVASGRWTPDKMHRIFTSRVRGTEVLAEALASCKRPPRVFVCASGINFYGDRGDALMTERDSRGQGFLADVCEAWEGATEPMVHVGTRVVAMRIGPVLSTEGGMLAELLPLFRLGLGGPIGGGRAYVSWVTLRDVVRGIEHVMTSARLHGAVNMVAPQPVRNATFTAALGRALHRPALLPVPAWAVRMVFGQMGEEAVLSSVRAVPERLLEDGFVFRDTELDAALRDTLAGLNEPGI